MLISMVSDNLSLILHLLMLYDLKGHKATLDRVLPGGEAICFCGERVFGGKRVVAKHCADKHTIGPEPDAWRRKRVSDLISRR